MPPRKPKREKVDNELCPICGEFMDVRCTGYSHSPFVDGRKYDSICQVCYETTKIWVRNGDTWEGPFFDGDHLYTPEEMVEEGATNDIKRAKKSLKAVKGRVKKYKPK